ncbi:hypothetical protein RCC89_19370 [Cytophagaceae bacterium ABcell3]|nr:hypothetical protein RCC89_19370 [Cytophagaceae bacterium ABcell3]
MSEKFSYRYDYRQLEELFQISSPEKLSGLMDELLYVTVVHSGEHHFKFGELSDVFFHVMQLRDILSNLKPLK